MEGREGKREEVTRRGKLKRKGEGRYMKEKKRNVLTSMMARVGLPF